MYYKKINVYVKDGVLLDLGKQDTYIINTQTAELIDSIYKGMETSDMKKYEDYDQIKNTFFSLKEDDIKAERNHISNIQLKVSNTCNLRCKYCYANFGNYGKKDSVMSISTARDIAKQIKLLFPEVEKISFFGGEPLLSLDSIKAFIEELSNENIMYSMVTNGTIMNGKLLNLLKDYNLHLCVSLDGSKEINDMNRVNRFNEGTYDIIAKNIDTIQRETGAVDMIAAVYTKPAFEKYSKTDIYEMLYKRFRVRAIGVADVFTDNESLKLPIDFKAYSERFTKDVEYTLTKIMNEEFFVVNKVYDIISSFFNKTKSRLFCGAGINSLFIDEEGYVSPCQLFTGDAEFSMGNILEAKHLPYDQTCEFLQIRKNCEMYLKKN